VHAVTYTVAKVAGELIVARCPNVENGFKQCNRNATCTTPCAWNFATRQGGI